MTHIIQRGMRLLVEPSATYPCDGGPADGGELAVHEGDIVYVARQPAGVNPGDPFIALSMQPSSGGALRALSTYRGEYRLSSGRLRWHVATDLATSDLPAPPTEKAE